MSTSEPTPTDQRANGQAVGFFVLSLISVMALIVGVIAVFLPRGSSAEATPTFSGPPLEVAVSLTEFKVTPASIDVAAGQKVHFTVKNDGTMVHDLMINGTDGTAMLDPGKSAEFTSKPITASTEAWCTVPGHKESGMVMKINVTGSAAGGTAAAPAAGASKNATIDPAAMPAADWKRRDPVLPPAAAPTVHNIEMHATEVELEVAPGVKQMMWTFNNMVPAPILRGHIGDQFNIKLFNDGKLGHSLDFHASRVAWDQEMRTIGPGESLDYNFKAEYAGAFMYHCGTAPTLHHIGNGMYGAIIIDPPNLPPVDNEFVIIQSELYLGPQGQPGDLTKMTNVDFDAVVFNGYYNQYKFAPIRVEPGQRNRVWVIDDGPSENSSFHIVGTIFDTVFKEGSYLLRPDARQGGSQALDLQPAQGGFVEFTLPVKGFYVAVTHKFSNVGKGAMGLFQAGDASLPVGGGGH